MRKESPKRTQSQKSTIIDNEEDEEGGSINLEELTKAQLVEYAAGQGIELSMSMTKKEMISEIEAG